MFFVCSAAATVRLESGAGGTALTGEMRIASKDPFFLPVNDRLIHYFETATGEALSMELGDPVHVDGFILYIAE